MATWYRYPPAGTSTVSIPSIGTNGAAAPASSDQIGGQDGAGNLRPYDVETVQGNKSLPTLARVFGSLVATDAVEAASTTTVINATAHVALVGDVIRLTSGADALVERVVFSKTANTITLSRALPSAPAAADTFSIIRHATPMVNASGGISLTDVGKLAAVTVFNNYAVTNVDQATWVELIAATATSISAIFVDDTSGQVLELGLGAMGSEVRTHLVPRGGLSSVSPWQIPLGSRLSVRAVTGSVAITAGELVITAFQ